MYTYNVSNNLSRYFLGLLCTTFLPVHGTGLPNPLPASQRTQTHGSTATAVPQEGVVLFNKLRNINLCAMEKPNTLQDIVAEQDILRVKKALQKILLEENLLPACITQTLWVDRSYANIGTRYVLYDVLTYIYGHHQSLLHTHQGFATYEAAYQRGIQPSHLQMLDSAIPAAHSVHTFYLQDASFYKAFTILTGGVYSDAIHLPRTHTMTQPNTSTQPSHDHLQRLAPMFRWLNEQSPRPLPKELKTCMLVYAYGKSFPSYDRLCTVEYALLQTQPVDCIREGKTITAKEINTAKQVLQYKYINENTLPCRFVTTHSPQFVLLQKSVTRPFMSEYFGFYTLHALLVHIKTTSYLGLLREGWHQDGGLCVEKALEERIQNLDTSLSLALHPSHAALVAENLACLLGVFGVFKACKQAVNNL